MSESKEGVRMSFKLIFLWKPSYNSNASGLGYPFFVGCGEAFFLLLMSRTDDHVEEQGSPADELALLRLVTNDSGLIVGR